ncbi:helix-turn-helix domain-containing protein [Pontiella sulfatireligans]|uniref:Helix-turn-helix domain-containing protein n=1 Tax=Pontiella sulfatireligans TaxID=2750658 RepID=A0A6C2UP01_9BACT|nr:helix-turn-helix domain-containing protein [Pontiella sulfatireligans]VGO22002.1 hypothetical protein SCARR_04082 [Pontiella sulfatireligans]
MKDILLIGGPASLTGVDRINDDLLSILAEENLYSRKAVIVWPTSDFLSVPNNPDTLQPHIDMNDVMWSVMEGKGMAPAAGLTAERIEGLKVEVLKDRDALNASINHLAMSEVVYRLSRLILDISGGLRLAVVTGDDAPKHALVWTRLVDSWKPCSRLPVKRYDTKSACYGALNAVKGWGLEFDCLATGLHDLQELLPAEDLDEFDRSYHVDYMSYEEVRAALDEKVEVSFPVESRTGNAMAVQVSAGDGFMIVVPKPDKPANFRIGLVAGGSGKSEGVVADVVPKPVVAKPRPASNSDEEYVTVKEAARLLVCSEKTVRNYYGDGRLKHKKVGQRKILILKSSVDALLGGNE